MTVQEIQNALRLIVELVDKAAITVNDCTLMENTHDSNLYDTVAFKAKSNLAQSASGLLEAQISTLVDKLQTELQSRFKGPSAVFWRVKPEITFGPAYARIYCRIRITPTLYVRPKETLSVAVN